MEMVRGLLDLGQSDNILLCEEESIHQDSKGAADVYQISDVGCLETLFQSRSQEILVVHMPPHHNPKEKRRRVPPPKRHKVCRLIRTAQQT